MKELETSQTQIDAVSPKNDRSNQVQRIMKLTKAKEEIERQSSRLSKDPLMPLKA